MNDHCDFKYQINVLEGVTLKQENRSCQRGVVADGRCFFHSDNPDKPLLPFIDEIKRQSSSDQFKYFDFCGFVFPKEAFKFPVAIRKPLFVEDCKFYGDISFRGLRFEGYTSFHNSEFLGEADFAYDGDLYERYTSFTNRAIFNGVKFHKKAFFAACRFAVIPDFQGTEFLDMAVFTWAEVGPRKARPGEDWLEFRNCRFVGRTDMEVRLNESVAGIRFAHCNLEGLLIGSLPKQATKIEFEKITKWYQENRWYQWHRKKIRDEVYQPYDAVNIIDSYRYLERYFYDHSDASLARHFYIGQMVALRRDLNYDKASRLMNRLYQLVSNYGESIWRPALFLVLSLAVFPVFLLFSGMNVSGGQYPEHVVRVNYDLFLGSHNTTPAQFWSDYRTVVGANLSLSTFDRKNELSPPPDSVSKGILVVETVLNVVLASLIVVGVRRKFTPKKPLGE